MRSVLSSEVPEYNIVGKRDNKGGDIETQDSIYGLKDALEAQEKKFKHEIEVLEKQLAEINE